MNNTLSLEEAFARIMAIDEDTITVAQIREIVLM